ncbi:MAG: hypothetical protein ACYDC6_11170 [Acidobacteriaceae bacterium]
MKRTRFFLLAFSLLCATGGYAADRDLNAVVSGVEHRYSTHPQRIPLMGLIGFCARVYTHGGVKSMRVVEFEDMHGVDAAEMAALVQSQLGSRWQPFMAERGQGTVGAEGEYSTMFARPEGRSMRLMIANYDHGELDLARLEVNGASLSKWINRQEWRGGSSPHTGSVLGE